MARSVSSAARMVWLFISKARWVRISSTSSLVGSTFEASRKPLRSVPKPSVPGLPSMGGPEAADSTNRLPPTCLRPSGLMKVAISSLPTTVGSGSP